MVCRTNGIPINVTVPRRLVTEVAAVTSPGGGAISLNYVALFEMQMEQWTAHVSALPTTVLAGEITLRYIHRSDARQDTLLRSFNFAQEAKQDLVCVVPFRWKAGDEVQIDYANVDDLTVGTQFMGIEIIP